MLFVMCTESQNTVSNGFVSTLICKVDWKERAPKNCRAALLCKASMRFKNSVERRNNICSIGRCPKVTNIRNLNCNIRMGIVFGNKIANKHNILRAKGKEVVVEKEQLQCSVLR